MKRVFIALIAVCLMASAGVFAESTVEADQKALAEFMKSDVVKKFKAKSYGYAIFPTIGKGGIGIGGAHGSGGVYLGDKKTADASMTQLSIGFQFGGQAYRQVIFFEDKRAYDDFTSGNFEFGAQASAIAITASADAAAGTEGAGASADSAYADANFHKGMIVFTQGKGGLMYQATLGGQKYSVKFLK